MKLKCFALWQPWATLVIEGLKKFETRSLYSRHRGLTGIHATKSQPAFAEELFYSDICYSRLEPLGYKKFEDLPRGGIIGTVNVDEWLKIIDWNKKPVHPKVETNISSYTVERAFGDWKPGRYAIQLSSPHKFKQMIPAIGRQGLLFDIDVMDIPTLTQ